ncbi:uncharacterized protein Z518_08958 [Rhinocladiella mackenziei CBS 650.93]|uniref:Zn(2)-C6 fungal-type domain-containing protein n=1 Tax=Rhinocladiella mackenziei CBS 650.93 TaxID=1442369 RepID=A0A0D2GSB6_9EURO|nr:uncharacterized protein Z518_08958 [Rhinocladiella mackenziei CBS 650.93]KIX01233.1 hypothetical protein Z518_08958 [Rhinocladiella mackenziei CBS 650.93]
MRRTRTNVRQSKYGCFTCRSRRVKCDEGKPSCARCLKSGRACEGYPQGAIPAIESSRENDRNHHPGFNQDSESYRLQALACEVFSRGFVGARTAAESALWNCLLPQLSYSVESVKESLAAFGASYEHQMLKRQCVVSRQVLMKRTAASMKKLREDLVQLPYGPLPILVACVLLSCSEIMQHKLIDALVHLRGAFSTMSVRHHLALSSRGNKSLQDDEISYPFRKLDLQVITYAPGRAPELPLSATENMADSPKGLFTIDAADRILFRILHSCYHFTSVAGQYKYRTDAAVHESLVIEQGRHIGRMNDWLSYYARCHWDTNGHDSHQNRAHGLVLQAQCLSALTYVSNIFEPFEQAYDKYSLLFQQIIECVENAFRANNDTDLPTFNPEMGIIQPLFWTAVKYRDSKWRSKAISLLRKCGREGPWCGYVEAVVAAAVVRAEEEASLGSAKAMDGSLLEFNSMLPQDILESARISRCVLTVKAGYYIGSEDQVALTVDLMNMLETQPQGNVVFTITYEFIPGRHLQEFSAVIPYWLDVGGCGSSGVRAYPDRKFEYSSELLKGWPEGSIIFAGGHLHDGGTRIELQKNDQVVCNLEASYSQYRYTSGADQAPAHISSIENCQLPAEAAPGDKWRIVAHYDTALHQPMVMMDGSLEPVMGIMLVYVAGAQAPVEQPRSKCLNVILGLGSAMFVVLLAAAWCWLGGHYEIWKYRKLPQAEAFFKEFE